MFFSNPKKISHILSGQAHVVDEVFDVSLRGPGLTSEFGQTTKSLKHNYRKVRDFGIQRTLVASFCFGDTYTVYDQFVEALIDEDDDLSGCFASLDIDDFEQALDRFGTYSIPNAFINVRLADDSGHVNPAQAQQTMDRLLHVLDRLAQILPPKNVLQDGKPVGEIFVNFPDFIEQSSHWDRVYQPFFKAIRGNGIDAICVETWRDATRPECIFEATQYLRAIFTQADMTILVHAHGGQGLDDACNLAATLGGANGVWSGLTHSSAASGHGGAINYLANLYRYGHGTVASRYHLHRASQIVYALNAADFACTRALPDDLPMFGRKAYTRSASAPGRPVDLPPAVIGAVETTRFVPLQSDVHCVRRRLLEVGYPTATTADAQAVIDFTHEILLEDIDYDVDSRINFNSPDFLDAIMQSRQVLGVSKTRVA
ncbi:MAG: hypothetical protein AB8B71_00110 [Paracoccaceae bacterium]